MGKKILGKEMLSLSRVVAIIMIILGCSLVLFFMPIWIWFVLIGILLVVIGFSI